ncbi:MAG: glycosyltransferase [Candidatus Aenigmarchaeota archaeon]|nr:glycosyltransferase [Candidatus Aenigmarchaeota archaeon]
MISVIVPTYNSGDRIGKCISALLHQDYKEPYEIIVVDDGSDDNTVEVVKQLKVRLVEQRHKGPAVARNLGVKKARGSIVLFTDSDCMASKNWISEMVKPFKNRKIAGVQGIYKTKQKSFTARFVQVEIEERYGRMIEKGVDGIGTYSAGYRKNIFLKMRGFDRKFPIASGEDFDLSYRIKDKGYMLTFNPNAVVYHQHPEGLGKYLEQKFRRASWRTLLYKKHPGKIKTESYTPQMLKFQIAIFYISALFLILSVFSINIIFYSIGFFVLLVLSTIPFSIRAFRKDRILILLSPIFLVLRTVVFGFGLIFGILNLRRG